MDSRPLRWAVWASHATVDTGNGGPVHRVAGPGLLCDLLSRPFGDRADVEHDHHVSSSTTTSAPGTSTSSSPSTTGSVNDEADGSGCTPGPGTLPDGEWFGYVASPAAAAVDFDLACWFTGDAAVRAAAEDGEESPPPNDYYVRNVNTALRTVAVAAAAEVVWYPSIGDPTSEATVTYPEWLAGIAERELMLGVWLEVEDGRVTRIREQWVP